MTNDLCESYCSHGGACPLPPGHEGRHDSGYCQWTDDEAITREQAQQILAGRGPRGRRMARKWDRRIPKSLALLTITTR